MQGYRAISEALASHTGNVESFMSRLDRERVPYLSYSKIASVEFCPHRYFLEYMKRVKLRPEPAYFSKGRTLHKAAERLYRKIARGTHSHSEGYDSLLRKHPETEDRLHLTNAIQLLVENAWTEWKVVGIERAFVFQLGQTLPPCIGVVDLILRKGGVFAVIDHKSGKKFTDPDAMQMVLYRECIKRKYKPSRCLLYFDEYRWVNDLTRIRKPAFRRTRIRPQPGEWVRALKRFQKGYETIHEIEEERDAPGTGECYLCPFKSVCNKVQASSFPWY